MARITPFLWFDGNGEEAVNYYVSIFDDSKVLGMSPGPNGRVMSGSFQLRGDEFMFLNEPGMDFKLNEATSLFVKCETQEEVDELWAKLTADGGEESQCGWLKDRFGLSWQIIPNALGELLGDPDREKAGRAMQAMLGMQKIDIAGLREAAAG